MRVMHIAPGAPFGGVQRIVMNLARAQAASHRVAILWTGEMPHAEAKPVDRKTKTEEFLSSGSLLACVMRARGAIKAYDPDIVHLHMPAPWIALSLFNIRAKICLHLHGEPVRVGSLKARLGRELERIMVAHAGTLVAISDWIEQVWRERYPTARYRVVRNGIPVAGEEPPAAKPVSTSPVVGFASRLAPDKGVAEFARFALAMHEADPKVRFRIAGDGSERRMLENELSSLVASGAAEILGHVSDMKTFWSQLDLAIFTAPAEPFGLRLIEPVAEGVPVIAYETGAGSDEIARVCAGIVLVPYEDPRAMAELAARLLSDYERRRVMVVEGTGDVARHFSLDAMTSGVAEVYQELLSR